MTHHIFSYFRNFSALCHHKSSRLVNVRIYDSFKDGKFVDSHSYNLCRRCLRALDNQFHYGSLHPWFYTYFEQSSVTDFTDYLNYCVEKTDYAKQ